MRRASAALALLILATPTLVGITATASAAAGDPIVGGFLSDDAAHLTAGRTEEMRRANQQVPPELRLFDYERAPYCREAPALWVKGFADGTCPPGIDTVQSLVPCEEGDTMVMPMWMRERSSPDAPWGAWDDIDPGGCGVDLLPVLTAEDFARLPLPAPALTMQPDRGWVLINIETIVWTDPTPVTLRTELLGYGITVEATPARWTYDFGDGHDLVTRSPGTPYPDHDVFHVYEEPHDEVAITLSTEWTGRYQVDGNPVWRDVNGIAVTSTTSTPFSVQERRARLVSGLCTDRPTPPDC